MTKAYARVSYISKSMTWLVGCLSVFFFYVEADIEMGNTQGRNTKSFSVHITNGLESPKDKLTISGVFFLLSQLTNNDTSHYIISLCAGSSVIPRSSLKGTQKKRLIVGEQQSCPSKHTTVFIIFCRLRTESYCFFKDGKLFLESCRYIMQSVHSLVTGSHKDKCSFRVCKIYAGYDLVQNSTVCCIFKTISVSLLYFG